MAVSSVPAKLGDAAIFFFLGGGLFDPTQKLAKQLFVDGVPIFAGEAAQFLGQWRG